jgi:HAE1 family hydrophobic/amphiphilic exporter-1
MLVITVLGLGVIARYRIPLEFLPPMDLPFIICQIPYAGATPEQVEKEVAIPAEGRFRTVSSLKRIQTTSDMNGCVVRMFFDMGTDMSMATAEVRDRIERLKLVLPDEIEQVFLRKFSANSMPVMALALYSPEDDEELTFRVRTVLQPRMMRLEGVADVSVFGKPEREVLIEFNQSELRSRGLSLFQVVSSLRVTSINLTVGDMLDGNTRYYVRAVDEFTAPEDLGQLVVGPNAVRLRDVANVGYRTREVQSGYAIDGQSGTFILIRKESEANAIATCAAVRDELARMQADPLFQDVQYFMFFDQSDVILSALEGLVAAGKFGGALAVVVLFMFLGRIRPTLIVALAIPASVVVALVFMFFIGMSLNLVTMISLIIGLGMLVDNSIVVIENITRHVKLGCTPKEGALRGASEMAMAITASTLTTCVVFIPILYMGVGEMSTYMRAFAVPITVSLGASLVIALTVIPLAASRMKPRHELALIRVFSKPAIAETPGTGASVSLPRRSWFPKLIHPIHYLIDSYVRGLDWVLRWRLATALVILSVLIVTWFIPFSHLKRQGMPTVDTRRVSVEVVLDQGFTLEEVRDTLLKIENILDEQREELGIKNVFTRYDPSGGSVDIYLHTDEDLEALGQELPYTTEQAMDILWQRLPSRVPGGELRFSIAEASETSSRSFSLQIRGDDARTLSNYAERLKVLMQENIPEITEVITDSERVKQEIQIDIDETRAEFYGLTPLAIAQTVDFALRGIQITKLKQGGREIPVWAQFQEEDRKTKGNLENVTVYGAKGEPVPINRVVEFSKGRSPQAITRVNGKNVVTVTSKIRGENLGGVLNELKRILNDYDLPTGYSIEFGDELLAMDENMASFGTALFLSAVLIYIVMGAVFESYLLPWSILTTLPLAGIGVVWSLYLSDTAVDTVTMIGVILLAGIVVNNGIVLIDYINQMRKTGMNRHDAIIGSGRDRFRPVMMTALTTILGCVPLAIGGAIGGEVSFGGLGRALIGGLTTGTVLTLFIVPLTYTIFDDVRIWFLEFFSNVAGIFQRA